MASKYIYTTHYTRHQLEEFHNPTKSNLHKTDTTFTRQGGSDYTQFNLIDGYYIKTTNHQYYSSTTNTTFQHNSDHSPVTLEIPANTLLAKPTYTSQNRHTKLLDSIPQENLDECNTMLFTNNSTTIGQLTQFLLDNEDLNPQQWTQVCNTMKHITNKLTEIVLQTCNNLPKPTLTNQVAQQGSYLPGKLQKKWIKHITTYHIIRKAISIIKYNTQWRTHPCINSLLKHIHTKIPPPPTQEPHGGWLEQIANIGKIAQKDVRTIITKHHRKQAQKALRKFQRVINNKLPKGNKAIFQSSIAPPLDSLLATDNIILTHPKDISNEIFIQQSIINAPTT